MSRSKPGIEALRASKGQRERHVVIIGQPDARDDVAGLVGSLGELNAVFQLRMQGDKDRRVALARRVGRCEAGVFARETSRPVQHEAHVRGWRAIGIFSPHKHMVSALRLGFVLKMGRHQPPGRWLGRTSQSNAQFIQPGIPFQLRFGLDGRLDRRLDRRLHGRLDRRFDGRLDAAAVHRHPN